MLRRAEATAGDASAPFDGSFLRKLERIELLARKVFRGQVRGEHSTSRRGRGLEFSDYRRYQPGDDFRYIDWNIFSRLDRLVLKLYSAEEDLTLRVLVDASASMGFGSPPKFDYARRLAACMACIGLNNLDRVMLHPFGEGLRGGLGPLRTRARLLGVLDFLGGLDCGGSTDLAAAASEMATAARGAGLVVLVSDLMAEDGVGRALDTLRHAGHEVVLLHVLDETEIEPGLDGVLRLVDAEEGGELKVTVDEELRTLYARRLQAWLAGIESDCRRTGTEYLRTSTAIDFEDVLLRYLRGGAHLR